MEETAKRTTKTDTSVIIKDVTDFDPNQIFDCGQCFRWKKEDINENQSGGTSWYGVVQNNFARIKFEEKDEKRGDITIESYINDEEFWIRYLDLHRNYGEIKNQLSACDPVMERAIEEGRGIRILRQNPWETLISFIISQNSNIPRIRTCIEALCREYGKEIGEYKGEKLYSFPDFGVLSTLREDDLNVCRLGYRAKYIAEAARQIERDGGAVLDIASSMEDASVLKYLLNISGIGPKVASCIMLFSMGKLNIFPIDIWVKRVMNRLYAIGEDDIEGMKKYAKMKFGKYGGIAQQYLFYYIRRISVTNPKLYESMKITEKPEKIEL